MCHECIMILLRGELSSIEFGVETPSEADHLKQRDHVTLAGRLNDQTSIREWCGKYCQDFH